MRMLKHVIWRCRYATCLYMSCPFCVSFQPIWCHFWHSYACHSCKSTVFAPTFHFLAPTKLIRYINFVGMPNHVYMVMHVFCTQNVKNKHGYWPVTNSTESELAIFWWLQENTTAIHFDTNLQYFYLILIALKVWRYYSV